jgi:hypothetical protein
VAFAAVVAIVSKVALFKVDLDNDFNYLNFKLELFQKIKKKKEVTYKCFGQIYSWYGSNSRSSSESK